jgi:hypothetical protein
MTKKYQRGNQNPYIEEEQTTQWSKDTKGVIRISISKKKKRQLTRQEMTTWIFVGETVSHYKYTMLVLLCVLF